MAFERLSGLWASGCRCCAFRNGITLNYAVILYDKSRSKIQIVQEIAEELPAAPVISYFLCDSWYTTAKVMDRFIRKGFYTVGALKTNRILYPCGIRQKPVHLPFICGKQTRMSAS
ncbi:MAG: transposase [Lacrimispora saccharolytica]